MEMGTLLHAVLEEKGKLLVGNKKINYDELINFVSQGLELKDDKYSNYAMGTKELSKKYFEEYYLPDNKSGMNYQQKVKLFLEKVLPVEMETDDWKATYFEQPFEFVYDDRVIIHGFIDRIDTKKNSDGSLAYRVVDYKTSKAKIYEKSMPTAMQMFIYGYAVLNEFDVLPEEYLYRFILIDEYQSALTKGWQKRSIRKLDSLLDKIDESEELQEYAPKPTPLCHWCNYCITNTNAKEFVHMCPYYSLWTPNDKNFAVNQPYDKEDETRNNIPNKKPARKLIF